MKEPNQILAEYGTTVFEVMSQLARAHDVPFYPFFLEGVATEPTLNQDDGIHPNADGVAVIVEKILPEVLTLLGPR